MISPTDRIYYTDPLINHAKRKGADEVLVTRLSSERTYNSPMGQVHPFTSYFESGGFMYYSVDGLNVEGQLVSARDAFTYEDRLILFSTGTDARFAVGHMAARDSVTGAGTFENVVFSDASTLPSEVPYLTAARHVAAAPWARELMPLPGEPDEVSQAKAETARWLWNKRRAEAVITVEAQDRGYEDNLDDLIEGGHVGKPGWMWLVTARVIMPYPVEVDMPDHVETMANDLTSKSIGPKRSAVARPVVPATLFLNMPANPEDSTPPREQVLSNFRAQLNNYSIEIADWDATRILYKLDTADAA